MRVALCNRATPYEIACLQTFFECRYPPCVSESIPHSGATLFVRLIFRFGQRHRAAFKGAFVDRVHILDIDIDRRARRCGGWREISCFHHHHRIADPGLDVETFIAAHPLQFYRAKCALYEFGQIEMAVDVWSHSRETMTNVFLFIVHTLP